MTRTRVAVLVSGRGSNMAALLAAAADPSYPAEIALVLSNRADAAGLAIATAAGVPVAVVPSQGRDRAGFEAAMQAVLDAHGIGIIALAGFMRVLTPGFVAAWEGRMINIHPSLLPAFPGLDTHARALARGVRLHGCTVHLVTPGVDEGPILAQAAVPVLPGDTEATLAARVLTEEHRLYPAALARLAAGRAVVDAPAAIDSLANPLATGAAGVYPRGEAFIGDTAMAEQSHPVEFVEVRSQDILENRAAGWDSFNKAATYAIAAIAALLVMMLVFLV